jgi:hypothetical protein
MTIKKFKAHRPTPIQRHVTDAMAPKQVASATTRARGSQGLTGPTTRDPVGSHGLAGAGRVGREHTVPNMDDDFRG